jgi:hypothetical protein
VGQVDIIPILAGRDEGSSYNRKTFDFIDLFLYHDFAIFFALQQ